MIFLKFINIKKKVDGWDVIKNKADKHELEKKFEFKNFLQSQNFVLEVGKIAEQEGHHPDISFGWGYAKINITTHAKKKLMDGMLLKMRKIYIF